MVTEPREDVEGVGMHSWKGKGEDSLIFAECYFSFDLLFLLRLLIQLLYGYFSFVAAPIFLGAAL